MPAVMNRSCSSFSRFQLSIGSREGGGGGHVVCQIRLVLIFKKNLDRSSGRYGSELTVKGEGCIVNSEPDHVQ
jgi:hypothetical protein